MRAESRSQKSPLGQYTYCMESNANLKGGTKSPDVPPNVLIEKKTFNACFRRQVVKIWLKYTMLYNKNIHKE